MKVLIVFAVAVLGLTACETKLYVPMVGADGKPKSIKVVSIGGDATNVTAGYRGPAGEVYLTANELSNSANTKATGQAIAGGIKATGDAGLKLFTGAAGLEYVKGGTKTALAKEKTKRHTVSESTKRHLSDNSTKVKLAEVEAIPAPTAP